MKNFSALKKFLPQTLSMLAKAFRGDFNYRATNPVCPFCNGKRFLWCGKLPILTLECRSCGSNSRERMIHWAIKTNLIKISEPILHFAPEKNLEKILKEEFVFYKTADKYFKADIMTDIENISVADNSISTIIVSHVLDVVNLSVTLCELKRILKETGAVIIVTDQSDLYPETQNIVNKSHWESLTLRHYNDQKIIAGTDFNTILEQYFSCVRVISPPTKIAIQEGIFPIERIFLATK